MSKRQPSRSVVLLIPPTTESASSRVDVRPDLASWYAAVSPAGPAPMMTASRGSPVASEGGSMFSLPSLVRLCRVPRPGQHRDGPSHDTVPAQGDGDDGDGQAVWPHGTEALR